MDASLIKVTRLKIQALSPLYWNSRPSHQAPPASVFRVHLPVRFRAHLWVIVVLKAGRGKEGSGCRKSVTSQPQPLGWRYSSVSAPGWPWPWVTRPSSPARTAAAALACSSADPKASRRRSEGCAAYIHQPTREASISTTTKRASRLWEEIHVLRKWQPSSYKSGLGELFLSRAA